MNLLNFVTIFPQFIQYIIINDIIEFNEIIVLSQICKELNEYFHRMLRSYNIICNSFIKYIPTDYFNIYDNKNKIGEDLIFRETDMFYQNDYEKQLFQKIYKKYKFKPQIDIAARNRFIVVLEWYRIDCLENKYFPIYTEYAINWASSYGNIDVLNWFKKYSYYSLHDPLTTGKYYSSYPNIKSTNVTYNFNDSNSEKFIYLKYNVNSIDWACSNGHVDVLDWWYNYCHEELGEKWLEGFKYSKWSIDWASSLGCIEVLNWWFKHSSEIPLKYSKNAIDWAASYNKLHVLNWWWDHNPPFLFMYTNLSMDWAASNGHVNVLEWFFKRSEQYANNDENPECEINSECEMNYEYEVNYDKTFSKRSDTKKVLRLKYSEIAMDWASIDGHIDVLNWFLDKHKRYGLKLKYSKAITDNSYSPIVKNWWQTSGILDEK